MGGGGWRSDMGGGDGRRGEVGGCLFRKERRIAT